MYDKKYETIRDKMKIVEDKLDACATPVCKKWELSEFTPSSKALK